MTFREKLQRLMHGKDQATVARAAGINAPTLNNYLNESRSTRPSADAAVALANYFGCDLAWLLDDSRDWGERERPHSLSSVHPDLLRYEIWQRYITRAIEAKAAIDFLEKVDWQRGYDVLKEVAGDHDPIPHEALIAMAAINHVFTSLSLAGEFAMLYDMSGFPVHIKLPPGIEVKHLEFSALKEAAEKKQRTVPGLNRFRKLMGRRLSASR